MRYALLLFVITALGCSKAEPAPSSQTEPEPAAKPEAKSETKTDSPAEAKPVTISAKPSEPDTDHTPVTFEEALPELGFPTITIGDAGSPPLRQLRWKFKQGSKTTAEIKNSMTVEMLAGTQQSPETSAPSLSLKVSLDTVEVMPNGSAKVAFELLDGKVDVESSHEVLVSQQMRALDAIKGLSGTYTVDANGVMSDLEFAEAVDPRGAELADDFKRMLRLTTMPVPKEEVGVGGKWIVEQVVEQGGVRLRERRYYKISELDGSRVGLDVTVQTMAPPQTVRIPGQGIKGTYQLRGYKAEGTETLKIDLTQLAPSSRDTEVVTTQRMFSVQKAANTTTAVNLRMHVNTTLARD
jgi:hypothetical protein